MLRSRPCRGAVGFVAAALVVSQGCYVYRPATLPVPAGAAVHVRGAPLEIYRGPINRDLHSDCRASAVYGALKADVPLRHPLSGSIIHSPCVIPDRSDIR